MENPKIRIESDGEHAEVYLDGKQVEKVLSVEFSQSVEEIPILKLEITR
jgi:hypothetical protein